MKMEKQIAEQQTQKFIDVLIELSEDSAIKFVRHNGYDELLCERVYYGFCQNCPQYKKRCL